MRKALPDPETLKSFLNTGKTVDWISEKWNVKPQTVKAWFAKFNINLPLHHSTKTQYNRNIPSEVHTCPVCSNHRFVYYIVDIKRWYCTHCETEFDQHQTIFVYDDNGNLVEVIGNRPDFWMNISFGRAASNTLIKTVIL